MNYRNTIILALLVLGGIATAQPAAPIRVEELPGFYKWGDEEVEIRVVGWSINMKGKYNWSGSFLPDNGKIHLFRLPRAAEMSPDVPEWARKVVEGKLMWELKLQAARDAEGKITFTGTCDYGRIVFHEERDRVSGEIKPLAAREEKAADAAVPATFTRTGDLPPKIMHVEFSRKVEDLYVYSDGWLGFWEPAYIRVTYDPAPKEDELDVTLNLPGGVKQVVKVKRDKRYNKQYISDEFLITMKKTATTQPAR